MSFFIADLADATDSFFSDSNAGKLCTFMYEYVYFSSKIDAIKDGISV